MKLLKTIKKLIQEAEERYNQACESSATIEELDRLEKNYKDSLKLLKIYKSDKVKGKNN
jgi:DNA invertase Pin-like site-specific DNA recombinase